MSGQVYRLEGAQRDAIDPRESVWLSASAGTGKTQVLSARVLRLLLRPDTRPEQLLCLTFTKAGAAEMAVRVNSVLARWVRLPETELAAELSNIGAPIDPASLDRARSLFASVLDCPGGGLRIDTIHAFAQYLLASFPEEARLMPGTSAMDDRERDLLSRQVLGDLVEEARRSSDPVFAVIETISRSKGPDAVLRWLMRCTAAQDLWTGPGGWSPPMRPRAARLVGLPADLTQEDLAERCADDAFPVAQVREIERIARDWNTKTGTNIADFLSAWLTLDPAERLDQLGGFYGTALTKAGTPVAALAKRSETYERAVEEIKAGLEAIGETAVLIDFADTLAPMLELGRRFALRWDEAKAREGLIDFDDQIRRAARLLGDASMAAWIRYKMDRQFDHVLIDEAQDTNSAQWDIVFGLIDDFYAGLGAREGKVRTIFTVGDYKQAIFGFQGTSPRNFEAAKRKVAERMAAAANNAALLRDAPEPRYLKDFELERSYRTSSHILDFVDRAIAEIGPESFGLSDGEVEHVGENRPGIVALWNTVKDGVSEDDDSEDEEGGENWLSRHDRKMADKIARQVARWMTHEPFELAKGQARCATPGDVMVLVRKRRELASLIVARLYAHGVPVAGVDRLRLGNPLAVKDLMAAIRFAVQPNDDLNLANLLVSPLCGWSQEDLLTHGYRPDGVRLWDHLRKSEQPPDTRTVEELRNILARADFSTPQALLHYILVGPMRGRAALIARLGSEANDPIDELLNAAQSYAGSHIVSLQGFIQWFDAGEGELKREAGEGGDQVRVMTVHGSKGLQAPIVILADAAGKPSEPGDLLLEERLADGTTKCVPIPRPAKEQRVGPLLTAIEEANALEMEEHWRLLYVAMTRAEEALFIGGSLGPRDKGEAPENSWYAKLKSLFEEDALEDPIWGSRWEIGERAEGSATQQKQSEEVAFALPEWVRRPVGAEPRPPRPLSPSALGQTEPSFPPLKPDKRAAAALRGTLIHKLLERLPDVPQDGRSELVRNWLARHGEEFTVQEREEIGEQAISLLEEARFADLFGENSLAEVPFSAIVEGRVVIGTVDRLVLTDDCVRIVDYKTTRRPPSDLSEIPEATIEQMAAYAAALKAIYPDRAIEVYLVYTHTPKAFVLPDDMLESAQTGFAEE